MTETIELLQKIHSMKYSEIKLIASALKIQPSVLPNAKKVSRHQYIGEILTKLLSGDLPNNWFESAKLGFDPWLVDEIEENRRLRQKGLFSPIPKVGDNQTVITQYFKKETDQKIDALAKDMDKLL